MKGMFTETVSNFAPFISTLLILAKTLIIILFFSNLNLDFSLYISSSFKLSLFLMREILY